MVSSGWSCPAKGVFHQAMMQKSQQIVGFGAVQHPSYMGQKRSQIPWYFVSGLLFFCWAAKLWPSKFNGKFPSGLWRDVLTERATFKPVGKVDIFPQMAKWWSCKSFLSRFQRVKRFSIFLARRNSSIWKFFSFSFEEKRKQNRSLIHLETEISILKVFQKPIFEQMQIHSFSNPKIVAHTHLQLQLASQSLCPTSPPRRQHVRAQSCSSIPAKLCILQLVPMACCTTENDYAQNMGIYSTLS